MDRFSYKKKQRTALSFVGITFLLAVISVVILSAYGTCPAFHQVIRQAKTENILVCVTAIIALANIVLVYVTARSLRYAGQANTRAERLFVGENRPLVDVTPIAIRQNARGTHATTAFSIVNYSGFKAYKISIDLKYGTNSWIREWIKAREEKQEKGTAEGVVAEKFYFSQPKSLIPELGPGETKGGETEHQIVITGSLNLEDDVCAKGDQGMSVWVRVTWKNYSQHVFDSVYEYRLICTKDTKRGDPAGGCSFTFIPLGIVSQKDRFTC